MVSVTVAPYHPVRRAQDLDASGAQGPAELDVQVRESDRVPGGEDHALASASDFTAWNRAHPDNAWAPAPPSRTQKSRGA